MEAQRKLARSMQGDSPPKKEDSSFGSSIETLQMVPLREETCPAQHLKIVGQDISLVIKQVF